MRFIGTRADEQAPFCSNTDAVSLLTGHSQVDVCLFCHVGNVSEDYRFILSIAKPCETSSKLLNKVGFSMRGWRFPGATRTNISESLLQTPWAEQGIATDLPS